jgi:site-specific DNA-methyltransferase (adenine-specific)
MSQTSIKFQPAWAPKEGILIPKSRIKPIHRSGFGALYEGDCLKILSEIENETVDTVFADPPFNLDKKYGSKVNDKLPEEEYVLWCKIWIKECERILKPGGSIFLYNIPKWNIIFGSYLNELGLTFRHWIAVNIKLSLPIQGRLYPSHYSLLYYTKGRPKTFNKIRTPIEICRHCGGEVKDYGGHRDAMNPLGVNLTDVWNDIPPVRHWKFKSKNRKANQLSTKLLYRVIHLSTNKGDLVLDPFGGSGTTYDVCEREERNWIGIEIENTDVIIERLEDMTLHSHKITDHVECSH